MEVLHSMLNPYKVLEVKSTCTREEAHRQFRLLSKRYHPDNLVTGDEEKFKEVNEAWMKIQEYGFDSRLKSDILWRHKTLFSVVRK